MKKQISIILFASVALYTATLSQPRIKVVGGPSFTFGEIYKGEKVEHKVQVKNVGNATLVIMQVKPSCGCTATSIADKEIEPGKTSTFTVSFDSKNFTGEVHKNVLIFSNDRVDSLLEVKFTANIVQVLEATPPYFYFKPGLVDSTMSTYIILKNLSDRPVEILSVTSTDTLAQFSLRSNKLEPGQTTMLTLTITPKTRGYIYKDVFIKTSHPKQPELTLKFVCNVVKERK